MGMSYVYAGSASYPRFNDELRRIVELFGGKVISEQQEPKSMSEFFMAGPLKYEMPEGTPEAFVKFVNDPYRYHSFEDTKAIVEFMAPKWKEAEAISWQITEELRSCVENEEGWEIYE
ncbi:MAG: hypothetical protein LIR46_09340 [Bacteroidota bacterium]|nr:hypothetical protein [Bacteroidota bacterium]